MQDLSSPPVWRIVSQRLEQAPAVLLALDFDGTLAPIVDYPDKAAIPSRTLNALKSLFSRPRLRIAILSGRALTDVKVRVGIPGLIYCGNHGLEMDVDGQQWTAPGVVEAKISLEKAKEGLIQQLQHLEGVTLEDKGFSISVHHRQASLEDKQRCLHLCKDSLEPFLAKGKLKWAQGKEVIEVQLPLEWDKGACLRRLVEGTVQSSAERPLCIYVGDDLFDEPAFHVVKEMDGIGVLVGNASRGSAASFYLSSPQKVQAFLTRLAAIFHRC